jgi:hypothetical protein
MIFLGPLKHLGQTRTLKEIVTAVISIWLLSAKVPFALVQTLAAKDFAEPRLVNFSGRVKNARAQKDLG